MDRPTRQMVNRFASQPKIEIKDESHKKRNVKFSQNVVDNSQFRKKHHSASILKKRHSVEKPAKPRSDSANSMASQGPFDDQSCENSSLNKNIKQDYFNLLNSSKKKDLFVDEFFPPVMSSLFSYAARKVNKNPNVKWMRISQVFTGRELVVTHPSGSKVQIRSATNLSSDYFSLALNTLKTNRAVLKKMFEDQKFCPTGIYYVKMFQANAWKYMIVDDYIPVLETEGLKPKIQPVFITCETAPQEPLEIWPFILEKAYAKYYSCYQALQTGNIFDFLEELTNKTCDQYNLQDDGSQIKTILSAPDVLAFGETKQLVKVPIQIGVGNSNKVMFQAPNRQKLIVDPDDLGKHLSKIYVIGGKNYNYIGQCPIRQAKQSISMRQFVMKSSGFVSISLNQKDKKFFQQPLKYAYVWVRMIIVQKQYNGGYRWIDGRYDNQKTLVINSEFQAGQYYIIIMPEWGERSYDLTLIIRTKFPVRLERKAYQQGMLEEACADLAQRYGRLNQLNTFICSYNCIHEDMGLIIQNINNERVKGQVKIVRSIDGLKSKVQIEAVNKQFQKNKSVEMVIKHGSHFTVVLKMKGGIDREFFKSFDFGVQ